jgi:hypothetical protein
VQCTELRHKIKRVSILDREVGIIGFIHVSRMNWLAEALRIETLWIRILTTTVVLFNSIQTVWIAQ